MKNFLSNLCSLSRADRVRTLAIDAVSLPSRCRVKHLFVLTFLLFTLGIGNAWGETYEKVTSIGDVITGDYVIVGCKTSSDFGLLTYNGSIDKGRIPYNKSYSSIPNSITDPAAESVWKLTVTTSGDSKSITLYNAKESRYIASDATTHDGKYKWAESSGLSFTITYSSGDYGSVSINNETYYLGVNKAANYWRGYASSTLTAPNGLTLYKKSEVSSYTITATSNNNSYGTVSVSGTTITATPKDGYRVKSGDAGYTVTSGTADVTNNGDNTFSVTPSSNCTITINFEAIPKYTVTLNAGSGTCAASVTEASAGAGVDLPTPTLTNCDDWTFAGWATSAVSTETTEEPTLIPAGNYKPTANTILYAVYQRTETTQGGGGTENKTYTHSITSKTWSANGEETLNSISWTLDNNGSYYSYDGTKGQQVGSGSSPAKSMTLTTSGFASATKITAVRISTSGASSINGTVSVKVGSTDYTSDGSTTVSLTSTNTQYEFTGSSTGNLTITWTQTSSKAIYFKAIEVDYQTTGAGGSSTTYYYSTPDCGTTKPRPSLSADKTELAFGNVTVNSSQQLTFTLSGSNLTANATLTISGTHKEMFSVSQNSVSPTDGSITSAEITVTYKPTAAGNHNATLTISSEGAKDVTVTLNGSATAPANVVNWSVKGVGHTTEFNDQNTPIYQLTDDEKKCGTKTFVGWTKSKIDTETDTKPTDLFTSPVPATTKSGDTYYAVYVDNQTTTTITYTWDLLTRSTTPELAVGDQIVITAKKYDYALSTTQNTDTRGAVAVTKNGNSITINDQVQIFTIEEGYVEGTFALATGNGYLSGTRRKAGRYYYEQLKTETSKASDNASWYIGFTGETTPHIYNDVYEKSGRNEEYPNYYVGFHYDYDWWTGTYYNYYFEAVRDASTWIDYNPENISIYRKTQYTTTTIVNSGYTTDCGCSAPQDPLSINDAEVVVNTELDLASLGSNGGTGGRISQYYCSDAAHTKIRDGRFFSADALGTYEITATQEASKGACETTATFTVTVTCATPSIEPTTYETSINTPVDLKSIITSKSSMPLSFAYKGENVENVYISGSYFTFLAAGTYTISATQEAGGIYCEGSQEIKITVTDPCAGKTKPDVTEGAITTDGFTLSWSEITGVSTYRVYNNTTGDSDETSSTSYTFSGLNPSTEYSWTVEAVYSDGCTAATSGTTTTSVVKYTVNWNVAGYSYGSSTTVNHGEKVSALPTAPNPAELSCGDKVFVGWSKSHFVDGTRPADLFTTVEGSPVITAATTFYAVFADCVTGGDTPEDDTQGEWTLVTNVNDLQAGDKIIIACYSKEKAAGDLTSAILSVDADVTFSNNGNTLTPSASTLIFTLGGSTDAWTLANSSGQLLGATAVKKLAWDGGTTNWKISISGNNATIQNGTDGYGRFLYNEGSPRFTTYTSGTSASMLLPQIYKKTGNGSGGGETPNPDPEPEPTGNAYVKVTSSLDDYSGEYLIVYEDGKVAFNGGLETLDAVKNTIPVTISNNAIAATGETNDAKFTIAKIEGGYSIKSASGQYIGHTKYDNGLTASTSTVYANSISVSDGVASISLTFTGETVTLKYNKESTQNRFRYYKTGQQAIALYKLISTPAPAPARKVAMKKVAAVRAEKSEMVTRPVVKAPAALAAQGCTSYKNYTTICCATPITDLKFAAGANSITLYWNTAAASATATLYSDEACETEVATQSGIPNGTCTFTGLAKTTTYYAKVTTTDGCTAVLEVSTERPHVSVAEWAATQINIDVNTNEPIRVYLENEVTGGSTSGNQADELFFSKYYEATANVKLVAVYNGTADAIDLKDYTIKYGKTSWATNYIPLAEFATTANGFDLEGSLSPGEEMILYTKNVNENRDVAIMNCVNESYPDGKWIEVTTTNNTGGGSLSFGGDKTIALFKGGTMIDIIGGGTATKPNNSGASTIPTWGDAKGWTCDEGLSIDDGTMIGISTNRCLLVRNNTVTSGANAVEQNKSNFVTLCTEWKGAHVPDDAIDDGVAASCENFAFVGTFDYSDYYVKYEELATSDELPADGRLEDGTYKVTTPDLHDLACTNMRISVKSVDGKTTLVTQDLKVPIIVDDNISTNDPIYFQYTQRNPATPNTPPADLGDKNENVLTPDICAECDIVIRDSKTLTHVQNGRGQFRNMMVYPNAKMDNQAKQPFNLNTLQMQGQNDAVSYAIIENDGSTIDVGDMVFVKRIDDKYWYNFSLPYDCKVADIIQQNGQSMGKYWVDWGIKEYDGKARQAAGTSAGAGNVGLHWKKVEETATLKAHQGYIIGLFTTEWKDQMKFVYFTPTNTNPYREAGDDAKKTTIDSWYTTNQATVAARHRGWNFTGSPYISRFGQSTADQGLNNTSLIMTGYPEPKNSDEASYTTYTDNVYVTIPSTQGGKYYSHYMASEVELLPFTAYFVQAADVEDSKDTQRTLTYAKGNRALPTSAPARTPAATKQRVLVELLVTAPDGQTDNTGVWVDERYTPEYEIAADLGKMYVAGAKPQLYTLAANGDMMAYHALPDASAMNIPLRLYAPKAGDYTLTLNQRVSRLAGAERVELLYNNAVVANMMLQDYTITANRGTVNGYSLSITRRADVSTAIDNITGTVITVIANDGYISVTDISTDAQVSVYDMLGRLLATQSANGQTVVNIPAVPQGVYNIVVGNNNGHTTIKTVIR